MNGHTPQPFATHLRPPASPETHSLPELASPDADISADVPDSSAQKRQSSQSTYPNNPTKRTPMQLPPPGASGLNARQTSPPAKNGATAPLANSAFRHSASARRKTRKSAASGPPAPHLAKTLTSSMYGVPLSPRNTHTFMNNNLNLSGSSPNGEPPTNRDPSEMDSDATGGSKSTGGLPRAAPPAPRAMSDEEQQLATKLKETYKNIVNFEGVVQKSCVELTMKLSHAQPPAFLPTLYQTPMGTPVGSVPVNLTELSNSLWTIYQLNVTLLNNYYDFLITALKHTANTTQFRTGKNIVDLYKIPRRMWVYGIVGFLEVLKSIIAVFSEHEVFPCFIAYCFSIVSNLTEPALEMEGWWCEKLGDLLRMAIALYLSRFIDWKISAEYWYAESMKTMYGHGKIYYHMCTVQQDNLDALVNIGKSVVCRDPFVPTQQYLRLVVENICTQRNILSLLELPIIDFIKIHKVLLFIHSDAGADGDLDPAHSSIHDTQLQYGTNLVTRYGLTFGCDSHGYNFFTRTFCIHSAPAKYPADHLGAPFKSDAETQRNSSDSAEKAIFWFKKGAPFAIANVNHLVGFADPRNPFAKLFQLPEVLKERKDKKDRKRKLKQYSDDGAGFINLAPAGSNFENPFLVAAELSAADWFYCLRYVNKSVLELLLRILYHYLIGPNEAAPCHVLVWLYFLLSVSEGTKRYPAARNMFQWLFRKLFPWEALINFLNLLLGAVASTPHLAARCQHILRTYPDILRYFSEHETLPEVCKLWGTLWFDVVCAKTDYRDAEAAGVVPAKLFDMPLCETAPATSYGDNGTALMCRGLDADNNERLVRIVLLARLLADHHEYGLVRTADGFRYSEHVLHESKSDVLISSVAPDMASELFAFVRDTMFSDGRLVENFVSVISAENLANAYGLMTAAAKDEVWFGAAAAKMAESGNPLSGADSEDMHMGQVQGLMDQETQKTLAEHGSDSATDISGSNKLVHALNTGLHVSPLANAGTDAVEGDLGKRMDTSLTFVTLDTNTWLKHCGRIFKCVRSGALRALIPLIVFQELRSLRKSAEATISDAATRLVMIIRELYLMREILPLRFDGTVASDINETAEFEHNSSWMSNVDLTTLNVVAEFEEISRRLLKGLHAQIGGRVPTVLSSKAAKTFRYCIIITDDRNMRLRAKTAGVTSFQSKWLFSQLEVVAGAKCID